MCSKRIFVGEDVEVGPERAQKMGERSAVLFGGRGFWPSSSCVVTQANMIKKIGKEKRGTAYAIKWNAEDAYYRINLLCASVGATAEQGGAGH